VDWPLFVGSACCERRVLTCHVRGQREITVGDALELFIITAEGTRVERFDLKKD